MIAKIWGYVTHYGVWYTIKKISRKLFVLYLLGPLRVNRRIQREERNRQEETEFEKGYLISILVPLYNTPYRYLEEMIQSVEKQTYANWQLCMTDGSDGEHRYVEQICRNHMMSDNRICYHRLQENKGIAENTNQCIDMAAGDFIALMDHDDLLHPSALYNVIQYLQKDGYDLVYTDEATFRGSERRLLSVHYKPEFYMENLRAVNYICHFTVFRRELLAKTGTFRKEYDGSQDYDLILRLCENAERIGHLKKVLYFWRAHKGSVALRIEDKLYAVDAGIRAVEAHLGRCRIQAEVISLQGDMPIHSVQYNRCGLSQIDVQILREEDFQDILLSEADLGLKKYMLLLKKEVKNPRPEAVECMLQHMAKPETAAVTTKIIGRRGRIISGDIEVGEEEGKLRVEHKFCGEPSSSPGYMNQLLYPTGIEVICNGCMLVKREIVLAALGRGWDLFDLSDWILWSTWMRNQGYELINETRAEAVSSWNTMPGCCVPLLE